MVFNDYFKLIHIMYGVSSISIIFTVIILLNHSYEKDSTSRVKKYQIIYHYSKVFSYVYIRTINVKLYIV